MEGIKALLLMGGSGSRFESALPKQFHPLSGKKIYLHTLERFLEADLFEEILLVCEEKWISTVQKEIKGYTRVPLKVVQAGSTRQESSFLGLLACGRGTRYVVIHDAVRPFVSQQILKENVSQVKIHGAIDTCICSADTIVHSKEGDKISSIPFRKEYLRGQTPQSFSYPLILEAHRHTKTVNASDDCSLVLEKGKNIFIVRGDEHNIKITTELDLFLAEQILRLKTTDSPASLENSLEGKHIAITGGTGGIGQALVKLLKQEGAFPLVISRTASDYQADLTSSQETAEIFQKLYLNHGELDGLINSAGLFQVKELKHLSAEEIQQMIGVNLASVIYSCKWARLKPKAHIINIASSSYSRGRKHCGVYSSTKAAVVNFTQALAEEWPELLINALVPQRTNTLLRQHSFPEENPKSLLDPLTVAKSAIALLKNNSLTGGIVEVKRFRDCF